MTQPLQPLVWLALALLLHGSRSLQAPATYPLTWLTIYAVLLIVRRDIPIPGPARFLILAFIAAVLTVPFAIDRLVAFRFGTLASTLVFPLAFVSAEFLQSRFAPGATWGSIAYTQYGYLPLMQVAAFVGIWGITFLIAWFASTVSLAWTHHFDWNVVRVPVVTYAAVLGVVVLGGALRLALSPGERPTMRVAAVNRPTDLFIPGEQTRIADNTVTAAERDRLAAKLDTLHDWFLDQSRREAKAGAHLVAWPEQNLLIYAEDEPAFLTRAQRLASEEHFYLAMGMGTVHRGEPHSFENKLVLIDPSGRIIMAYLKTHPVPGWEASNMRRGEAPLPIVATAEARIAGAICFDADFPEYIRQAGQGGADLLIVPANEWKAIKTIHPQMAAFRAIENGVALIRPAASGIATAVDPWGRLMGAADYFAPGDRTLVAQLPIGGIRTLYARTGDLFAWLCVVGIVVLVGASTLVTSSRVLTP